jgi:hypothetical protein
MHLRGWRIRQKRNQSENRWQSLLVSCLNYTSSLKMEVIYSSKLPLTLNGLHRVISQKAEVFITTAVRTPKPT